MVKISALVVIHNEENQINSCLESLGFADELVVILDNFNDVSKDIIKKFTTKYYLGDWPIEGDRRNFGINKCSNENLIY